MNIQEFKNEVEREFMVSIIMGLRYGSISEQKAQKLAQEYLEVMSTTNGEEIMQKLAKKIGYYSEFLDLYIRCGAKYFEQKKEKMLSIGRAYMQQTNYVQAVAALKGEIYNG